MPPVGTVAEEAARLVEMLAAAGGPWAREAADAAGGTPAGSTRNGAAGAGAGTDDPTVGADGRDRGSQQADQACTCGGTTPQACRICPVCQVISFVSSINPETIERAADLVSFAATALRDLATAQRVRQQGSRPEGTRLGEDLP